MHKHTEIKENQTKSGFRPVVFNVLAQVFAVVALCIAAGMLKLPFGQIKALIVGCVVFIVPNAYFTLYAFRYKSAKHAYLTSRSIKWGESGKLALVAMGFALVFKFGPHLQFSYVFAGFIFMVCLQWFIASRIAKQY